MPRIRGWVGGRGWRGWRRRVGGFTIPVNTGDQVMCIVGQTDGHNSLDYTMSHADVQWNRIGLQINAPQGPHRVYCGPS